MLDQRHDTTGHEPGCSYWFARARDLNDFDHAPARRDFDAATGPARNDLVGPRTVIRSHDDFDTITLHGTSVLAVAWASRPRAWVLPNLVGSMSADAG